jgi:hypothetical protein
MHLRDLRAMKQKSVGAEMSRSYLVEPIGPETIARAYPLIRAVVPDVAEHEWWQINRPHSVVKGRPATAGEREEVVVARNAEGYVKGLCIYAVRDHATYGRLIDVPFFIVAGAADGEGVTAVLIHFLRGKCDQSVCADIRFWTTDRETWAHRLRPDYIARSDHGLFLPALASTTGIMKALRAHGITAAEAIDRLSR